MKGLNTEAVEAAMTEASNAMRRRLLHARMADAAWAARTAYHAFTIENMEVRPLPDSLTVHLLQMAFATAWNAWE